MFKFKALVATSGGTSYLEARRREIAEYGGIVNPLSGKRSLLKNRKRRVTLLQQPQFYGSTIIGHSEKARQHRAEELTK